MSMYYVRPIDLLDVLNPNERRIFEARWMMSDPMTLDDLAIELGVARVRVRQAEVRAFEKVLAVMKEGKSCSTSTTQSSA